MPAGLSRSLHPDIEILPGTDVEDVWDRFEVFEALHHSVAICNPMTSEQLDEVIDAAGATAGSRVLDVACGSGEYLRRTAQSASINGTGVDLSPWMVASAYRACEAAVDSLSLDADLHWILGDAKSYVPPRGPDVAVCIGAEWVWHDFRGTARALAAMLQPGGVAVIGAARLHHQADAGEIANSHGVIDTIEDMAAALGAVGLLPLHRVDPTDAGWDAYLRQTRDAAREWQRQYPGERADQWVRDQAEWWEARERDRGLIGWSVWIAQKQRATE